MAYEITYQKDNATIDLQWIVPTGWSETAIREAFERQYSGAEIVSVTPCGEGCLVG
jgi:hypothetical protein